MLVVSLENDFSKGTNRIDYNFGDLLLLTFFFIRFCKKLYLIKLENIHLIDTCVTRECPVCVVIAIQHTYIHHRAVTLDFLSGTYLIVVIKH